MSKSKLTKQQEKFVEAMAHPHTKSQTQAAIIAGCPPKNARITASKWLTKSNIQRAITERKQRALAHNDVTPEEIIGAAAFQMLSSISDVLNESGEFDIERARATGAIDLVKKLKETVKTEKRTDGTCEVTKTVEIEMLTNADARKELAKYLGLKNYD